MNAEHSRRSVTAILAIGLLSWVYFAITVVGGYDFYVGYNHYVVGGPENRDTWLAYGIAVGCAWRVASWRLHKDWHAGKLIVMAAVALVVTLSFEERKAGVPLLLAVAIFAWYWFPNRDKTL